MHWARNGKRAKLRKWLVAHTWATSYCAFPKVKTGYFCLCSSSPGIWWIKPVQDWMEHQWVQNALHLPTETDALLISWFSGYQTAIFICAPACSVHSPIISVSVSSPLPEWSPSSILLPLLHPWCGGNWVTVALTSFPLNLASSTTVSGTSLVVCCVCKATLMLLPPCPQSWAPVFSQHGCVLADRFSGSSLLFWSYTFAVEVWWCVSLPLTGQRNFSAL